MPEVVISGDPYDICRLFHGLWRNGSDEDVAGVEGLIDWQVAAGKAAAWNAAGVQITTNVAAIGRTTAGNAETAPEVAVVVSPTSTEKAAPCIQQLPCPQWRSGNQTKGAVHPRAAHH